MNKFVRNIARLVNAFIKKSDWYNSFFEDCAKFWEHNTFNLSLINLGSTSSIAAFNYNGLNIKAANFALSHNPILGDEAILKNYCSYLNNNAVVLIPLCPFSSLAGNYEDFDDRYYTILYASSIPHYSKKKFNKVMHIKNRPLKYYPIYSLCVAPFSRIRYIGKKTKASDLVIDSQERIKSWLREFSMDSVDSDLKLIHKDSIKGSIDTLERIFEFCNYRNYRPIVVIPPMYNALLEQFSDKFKISIIKPLFDCAKANDVPILDYMNSEIFRNDNTMFINSFMLNNRGAQKFTTLIIDEIKNLGLL
jgi:hypothetical protein